MIQADIRSCEGAYTCDPIPRISNQDLHEIEKLSGYWEEASKIDDKLGMQIAHDQANLIRLKYYNKVIRYDYIYGDQGNEYTIDMYNETFYGNARPDHLSQFIIDTLITLPIGGMGGVAGKTTEEALTLRFSQRTASAFFSAEGTMAGLTIGQVANTLRAGKLTASDLPVDYVVRDGTALIVNTRSSLALTRAGISQSEWKLVNKTGDEFFERTITERLAKNGLTHKGTDTIRITGVGKNASNLE